MEFRLVVTASCNFNCYFCLNEYFGGKSKESFLGAQDYFHLVRVGAREFGIDEVTITGGEPLTRHDFAQIVRSLKRDSDCKITVVTNGSLLNHNMDALAHIDELHVSFHTFSDVEWERITRTKGFRQVVEDNIRKVREHYPDLRVKLNIVSEQANNGLSSITRYIAFGKELDLEINVFKEGYLRIAKVLGIDVGCSIQPAPMWSLEPFAASLIEVSPRKETYLVDGVRVSLSQTSTDEESWDSIWVGPTGVSYCNVFHDTPAIVLTDALHEHNREILISSLGSLIDEAQLNSAIYDAQAADELQDLRFDLDEVLRLREQNLPTIDLKSYASARKAC